MAAISSKLRSIEGGRIAFWCPGCEKVHQVRVSGDAPLWQWNQNVDEPTFSPSILVTYNGADAGQWRSNGNRAPPAVCHSFVRDGNIQFLTDCTHALAGQTVALPDWPLCLMS